MLFCQVDQHWNVVTSKAWLGSPSPFVTSLRPTHEGKDAVTVDGTLGDHPKTGQA
jgi:hypothetical protein